MAGYPELATLLARFPEMMMFRKFDKLSIQMLLYLQAELVYLENDLQRFSNSDCKLPDIGAIDASWEKMAIAFEEGKASGRKGKIQDIQEKLKTYHEMVLRLSQVQNLHKPAMYSHDQVNEWLSSSEGGNNFLQSYEADPWEKENMSDLVSLTHPGDVFDQWLAKKLTPIFHLFGRYRQPDTDPELRIGRLWEYRQSSFAAMGNVCCMLLSSAMPLISIFSLFYVTNTLRRLVLIASFTVAFSCTLGFVTVCRRSDIFAATAAFAAVQVVFLQGVNIVQTT